MRSTSRRPPKPDYVDGNIKIALILCALLVVYVVAISAITDRQVTDTRQLYQEQVKELTQMAV